MGAGSLVESADSFGAAIRSKSPLRSLVSTELADGGPLPGSGFPPIVLVSSDIGGFWNLAACTRRGRRADRVHHRGNSICGDAKIYRPCWPRPYRIGQRGKLDAMGVITRQKNARGHPVIRSEVDDVCRTRWIDPWIDFSRRSSLVTPFCNSGLRVCRLYDTRDGEG